MRAIVLFAVFAALAGCKPEKNPATGATGGPTATGPTQAAACDELLRNDKGEYSAGKCVCQETRDHLWRCAIGN
jgi:hypothetical protein